MGIFVTYPKVQHLSLFLLGIYEESPMSGPEFEPESFALQSLPPPPIVLQKIIMCHKKETSFCSCIGAGIFSYMGQVSQVTVSFKSAGTLVGSAALDRCNSLLFRCGI